MKLYRKSRKEETGEEEGEERTGGGGDGERERTKGHE